MSNLAWWLSVRGERMKDAEEYSRRAVAAIPDHPLYLWTRGLILEKLGRKREALSAMEKALTKLDMVPGGRPAYQADLMKDIARVRGS
jgi:Flp pilus assembly protein TadD